MLMRLIWWRKMLFALFKHGHLCMNYYKILININDKTKASDFVFAFSFIPQMCLSTVALDIPKYICVTLINISYTKFRQFSMKI